MRYDECALKAWTQSKANECAVFRRRRYTSEEERGVRVSVWARVCFYHVRVCVAAQDASECVFAGCVCKCEKDGLPSLSIKKHPLSSSINGNLPPNIAASIEFSAFVRVLKEVQQM